MRVLQDARTTRRVVVEALELVLRVVGTLLQEHREVTELAFVVYSQFSDPFVTLACHAFGLAAFSWMASARGTENHDEYLL